MPKIPPLRLARLRSKSPRRVMILLTLAGNLAAATRLLGQSDAAPAGLAQVRAEAPGPSPPFWANRGRLNFGAQLAFALENDIPRNVSHINLLIAQPQLAYIVHDFERSPVRRFEVVGEGIVGNAIHPGGHVYGASLLLRLDGSSHGRFVPFFDFGAGLQHTSLHLHAPELTGPVQFSPQGGPGIEFFFNPQRAIVLQYRYLHMSNAGIQLPNFGFNASMLSLGFRWLRRPRPTGPMLYRPSHHPLRYLFGPG